MGSFEADSSSRKFKFWFLHFICVERDVAVKLLVRGLESILYLLLQKPIHRIPQMADPFKNQVFEILIHATAKFCFYAI